MAQVVNSGATPHQSSAVSSTDFSVSLIGPSGVDRNTAQRDLSQQQQAAAIFSASYPKEFEVRQDQKHIYTKGVAFTVPVGASVDIQYKRELAGGGFGRGRLMPSDPSTISLQYDPVGSVHLKKENGGTSYSIGLFKGFKGEITIKVDGREFIVSSSGEIKDHAPAKVKSQIAVPKNIVPKEVKEQPSKSTIVEPTPVIKYEAEAEQVPLVKTSNVEKGTKEALPSVNKGAKGVVLSGSSSDLDQVSTAKPMFGGLNLGGVFKERVGQLAGQLTQGYEVLNNNGSKIGDALMGAFSAVSSVEQEDDVKADVVSVLPVEAVEGKAEVLTELSKAATTLEADKAVEKKVDGDLKQQALASEALRQQAEQERLAEMQRKQIALREARISFANGIAQEIRSVEEFDAVLQRAAELNVPVVAKFGATWCGPCQLYDPVVDRVAQTYTGNAKFVKVDTVKFPGLVNRYKVGPIPHTTVLGHGEDKSADTYVETNKRIGLISEHELGGLVSRAIKNAGAM